MLPHEALSRSEIPDAGSERKSKDPSKKPYKTNVLPSPGLPAGGAGNSPPSHEGTLVTPPPTKHFREPISRAPDFQIFRFPSRFAFSRENQMRW